MFARANLCFEGGRETREGIVREQLECERLRRGWGKTKSRKRVGKELRRARINLFRLTDNRRGKIKKAIERGLYFHLLSFEFDVMLICANVLSEVEVHNCDSFPA